MARTRKYTKPRKRLEGRHGCETRSHDIVWTHNVLSQPPNHHHHHHHHRQKYRAEGICVFFFSSLTRWTWANSFNGSKCYNGKLLAKHQCHPWNMKWLFRTCTNFESLLISRHRDRESNVMWCVRVAMVNRYAVSFSFLFLVRNFSNGRLSSLFVCFFLLSFLTVVGGPDFYDGLCFG